MEVKRSRNQQRIINFLGDMRKKNPPLGVAALAKESGISAIAIYKIIDGTTKTPRYRTMKALKDAFDELTGKKNDS